MNTKNKNAESNLARRDFLKTMGVAGAAAAVLPTPALWAADPAKPTTLAFVGCAHIHTPGFINLLKGRKDVVVKSVWDHDEARGQRRAKELNAAFVKDANAVWSDADIQAVVICSETNRHLELVQAAAKAGKHAFVEKPLGITARDSIQMAEALDKAKLLFTTGYFMRTDGKLLFLKDQIAKGNFGKITRIQGSNCHSGSLGGWFDTEWRWMADPKIAGVGGFGDLGTHSLDILMWMMGEVERVTAEIKVVTGRYGDCDESGDALIRFTNGVTGLLSAGWVDVANPVSLLISGTEGHAAIINDQLFYRSNKVEGAKGQEPWTKLPSSPPLPLNQFVDAVQGKPGMPLVTPREAAARVTIMEAMYQSNRDHRWVALI